MRPIVEKINAEEGKVVRLKEGEFLEKPQNLKSV